MSVNIANQDTGEVIENTRENLEQEVLTLTDHVRELQRTVRRQSREIGDLKRDEAAKYKTNPLWPLAIQWHKYHNKVTARKSVWKVDCFERAEPFLQAYGLEVCCAASDGIAAEHYVSERGNGTKNHHTTWKVLLRDTDRFEEAVCCCDRTKLAELREKGLLDFKEPKQQEKAPPRSVPASQLPLEEAASG